MIHFQHFKKFFIIYIRKIFDSKSFNYYIEINENLISSINFNYSICSNNISRIISDFLYIFFFNSIYFFNYSWRKLNLTWIIMSKIMKYFYNKYLIYIIQFLKSILKNKSCLLKLMFFYNINCQFSKYIKIEIRISCF